MRRPRAGNENAAESSGAAFKAAPSAASAVEGGQRLGFLAAPSRRSDRQVRRERLPPPPEPSQRQGAPQEEDDGSAAGGSLSATRQLGDEADGNAPSVERRLQQEDLQARGGDVDASAATAAASTTAPPSGAEDQASALAAGNAAAFKPQSRVFRSRLAAAQARLQDGEQPPPSLEGGLDSGGASSSALPPSGFTPAPWTRFGRAGAAAGETPLVDQWACLPGARFERICIDFTDIDLKMNALADEADLSTSYDGEEAADDGNLSDWEDLEQLQSEVVIGFREDVSPGDGFPDETVVDDIVGKDAARGTALDEVDDGDPRMRGADGSATSREEVGGGGGGDGPVAAATAAAKSAAAVAAAAVAAAAAVVIDSSGNGTASDVGGPVHPDLVASMEKAANALPWPALPQFSAQPQRIRHVLLVVHGMGATQETLQRNLGDLRESIKEMQKYWFWHTDFNVHVEMIDWKCTITESQNTIFDRITPNDARGTRMSLNCTLSDVIFYKTPHYRTRIHEVVTEKMNDTMRTLRATNDTEEGAETNLFADAKVSVVGHSLGSVIAYDVLTGFGSGHDLEGGALDPALRGQIEKIPKLEFDVENFFLMGSPLAAFVSIADTEHGATFRLPENTTSYNIFHPQDPVAFRLEPLIFCEEEAAEPPEVVAYWANNGVRPSKQWVRNYEHAKCLAYQQWEAVKNAVYEAVGTSGQLPPAAAESARAAAESQRAKWESYLQNEGSHPAGSGGALAEASRGEEAEASGEALAAGQQLRIDYTLQEHAVEGFVESYGLLQSHFSYWTSRDVSLLMLKKMSSFDAAEVNLADHQQRVDEAVAAAAAAATAQEELQANERHAASSSAQSGQGVGGAGLGDDAAAGYNPFSEGSPSEPTAFPGSLLKPAWAAPMVEAARGAASDARSYMPDLPAGQDLMRRFAGNMICVQRDKDA
eukprot:TRINITY_DN38424_c0_g1_i2.p1 TRINITY_DN38424_c0_g1~~TRINITY_DN38424_c0_g1_i2.p1  ORF type:complete len:937 (-),score=272.60 TRINITY_DN38424_c0_g1_i2:76-2886(-)